MVKTILAFWMVASVATHTASGQTLTSTSEQPTLTLGGAITEALAANAELRAMQREYEAARAAPDIERYLMPPMADVQIWGWPVTTLNPARTDMYMFMAEQQVPGQGKRAARVAVAERDADLSRQHIAVRTVQIVGDVRDAYIDLLFLRQRFDVYQRQAGVLADVAETATLRYAAGEGPQHHTVATVVELGALERERIAADARAQEAEARLNAVLGRPIAQPVETLSDIPSAAPVADVEQLALARHPDVAMVDVAVAREEAELARVRGERRPDYVVGGGYMLQPGDAGAWTARAGVTWPNAPWSRGRLNAQIEAQEKRIEAAKARHDVVATQIRQRVREAVVRLNAAERQVRLIETTVLPQIEHAFELARLAYAAGEGNFTDVLDARRMLLSTDLDYVEARANVARARADLESTSGVL
jgi:cobalt-zinc-cadmium efflux system outer membrane protein